MEYKFCYRCGNELEQKEKYLFTCNKCDLHVFCNPVPCNAVILENDSDEILLVKRGRDPHKGWWDLPGGFTNIGETMEQSARREIYEELKIEVNELQFLSSFYDRYLYRGINYPTLGFIFYGKVTNQKISANDDVESFQFFKREDIPFDKIAFPSLVEALKLYLNKTKNF